MTERILAEARCLFINSNNGNVSLPELLKVCSISEEEFYAHFKDLDALFIAVLQAEAEKAATCVYEQPDTFEKLMDVLFLMGLNIHDLSTNPETAQLEFLIVLRAKTHPEIAQKFYDHSYGGCVTLIQKQLEHARKKGLFNVPMSEHEVAQALFSVWQCLKFAKTRLGLSSTEAVPKEYQVKSGIQKIILPYMRNSGNASAYLRKL